MIQRLLPAAALLMLFSCAKEEALEVSPVIDAPFEQNFTLRYHQTAALTQRPDPELSVTLQELSYTSEWGCFSVPGIHATLQVADEKAQTQQVNIGAAVWASNTPAAYIDTTAVQANGKRYLIYLEEMKPGLSDKKTAQKDRAVVLRVSRAKAQ